MNLRPRACSALIFAANGRRRKFGARSTRSVRTCPLRRSIYCCHLRQPGSLTENHVFKEKFGNKRILLDDDQRRRLAVKAKILGRKVLQALATIVTRDTLLRWHRQLVAQKWDFTDRRKPPGRPPTALEVVEFVWRMARENPTWGYDRIQGALANLGHDIADTTVANILKDHGIEPAPERKRQSTWKAFLKAHWDVLAGTRCRHPRWCDRRLANTSDPAMQQQAAGDPAAMGQDPMAMAQQQAVPPQGPPPAMDPMTGQPIQAPMSMPPAPPLREST